MSIDHHLVESEQRKHSHSNEKLLCPDTGFSIHILGLRGWTSASDDGKVLYVSLVTLPTAKNVFFNSSQWKN